MSEQHTPESVLELAHGTYSMRDDLANQYLQVQSDKAELLAMLIEVRDDVMIAYQTSVVFYPDVKDNEIKERLERLDALIERMK